MRKWAWVSAVLECLCAASLFVSAFEAETKVGAFVLLVASACWAATAQTFIEKIKAGYFNG